jgi:hypothetical protein
MNILIQPEAHADLFAKFLGKRHSGKTNKEFQKAATVV